MKTSKFQLLFLLLFAFLGLPPSHAANSTDVSSLPEFINREPPVARFNPLTKKSFSLMKLEMQQMIYRNGDNSIPNHFCVVGYQYGNREEAVVIWSEQKVIIHWGGGDPDWVQNHFKRAFSLASSYTIDLNGDLVESMNDMHGGTTTTIRADAESLITDCNTFGTQYVIEPFTPPEDSED